MSKLLKSAEAIFQKRGMYVESPNKKCISVSVNVDDLPFLYLIHDNKDFNGLIMCLAVDYIDTYELLDLTIGLINLAPIALGEKFYISPEGSTYWGEEAAQAFTLDNLDVTNMDGPGRLWN